MIYTPTSHPGCRAPHAWLEPGKSTLDLFGKRFVVFEANEMTRTLYDRKFTVVRPDGHVAWRGDEPPAESVMKKIAGW